MKHLSASIIKKARQHAGLTQKELAELIHAGTNTLSCWEQGVHRPDLDQLARVARACKVAIVFVPTDTGEGHWEVHPLENLTEMWKGPGTRSLGVSQ